MFPILKKEFNSFFASPIAYLVIGVFLLVNGLFLWVFNDDFNILNAGFADLNNFFFLAPWILLFLIPAITMKSRWKYRLWKYHRFLFRIVFISKFLCFYWTFYFYTFKKSDCRFFIRCFYRFLFLLWI